MKIAITGPHCCGKTTVIEKVKEALGNRANGKIFFYTFSGESAPVDYSNAQKLRKDSKDELRLTYWMLSKLIERESDVVTEGDTIHLFDRCVFDQVIYTKVLLEEEKCYPIRDFVNTYMKEFPYDMVFILPVNLDLLQKHGTKDKSKFYAMEIHDEYQECAKELENRCMLLPEAQEKQVQIITDFIFKHIN